METFFINDTDIYKYNSGVSKNLDPTWYESFIRDAQLDYINKILGADLAAEILDEIANNTLTQLNEDLLNNYIKICHSIYTLYKAFPFLHVRVENSGISFNIDVTQQSIDSKRLAELRFEILTNADNRANDLQNYLETNYLDYPLYNSTKCKNKTVIFGVGFHGSKKNKIRW